MTKERWQGLMDNDQLPMTEDEIKEGWHFCAHFDGLLIGPGMDEFDRCRCGAIQEDGE